MSSVAPRSYFNQTRLAYGLALTLPFLCGYGSTHFSFLSGIPFTLAFLSIVLIATLGGLAPAIIAVFLCAIARAIWPIPGMPSYPLSRVDAQRAVFLICVAIIIGGISASRRKAQIRLQKALVDVQERNEALLESIAERKIAEAAVLRSEKLAAMGRLASTIAHEINNPLEAVTNLIYLARGEANTSEAASTYLEIAEKELARLAHITRLTLGFVRNTAVQANVDLATAMEEVLFILHHRLQNSAVRIDRHFEPGVAITIAPHELRQVVTNLLSNAVDATGVSGSVIAVSIRSHDGKAILLVEDDGDGIPAANLQRIFEPFFSTKPEVGTGIGLWVTREIVLKSGGVITAESGDLAGGISTRFSVEFPLAPAATVEVPVETEAAPAAIDATASGIHAVPAAIDATTAAGDAAHASAA
jgi:signal transduction histidine kinase